MTEKEERFDAIFLSIAQQMQGGVPELMDAYFGFLRRKTDFFTGASTAQARQMVLTAFDKQDSKAQEEKKKRAAEDEKRKKLAEEKKKKEEEDEKKSRIVEITDEEEKKILEEKNKAQKKPEPVKTEQTLPTKDDEEENEEDKGKLKPNHGNGSQTATYKWTQTLQEVEIHLSITPGIKSKQILCEFKATHLKVGVKGQPMLVDGELHAKVKTSDCSWTMDSETGQLTVTLSKSNQMEWWPRLVVGEPEINTRKITPENSKLEDLDTDTRGMVEKMRFDSMQKAQGLPSSDELQKQEMLKKFMAAHPEMDFSNAKIN